MKNKELQELLKKHPDDMEVLINFNIDYDGEITVEKKNLYHCNYTTKWQSNIDFYSETDENVCYKDDIDGKIVAIKIPTERKEFIILDC